MFLHWLVTLVCCCSIGPDARVLRDGGRSHGRPRRERLETLLETEGARAPGAAIAIVREGEVLWASAAGAAAFDAAGQVPVRRLEADTPVRAASISKLAVALTAGALEAAGDIDLDAPILSVLSRAPRHPLDPDAPITLRQLLSHTAGICDPARYWAELGEDFYALFSDEAAWCEHAPGAAFTYSNLGYALAASVLEAASDERFDRLARRYALVPAGIPGAGFNWSGVERTVRDNGGALHRWTDGAGGCRSTAPPCWQATGPWCWCSPAMRWRITSPAPMAR